MDLPTLTELFHRAGPYLGMSTFEIRSILAVLLVSTACGLVGALVVGNRMAFFSDAMAHTAFAGVAIGLLAILLIIGARNPKSAGEHLWIVPYVMVAIGIAVGLGIAFVREQTGLTNDTVIGVFFAGAIGFGAMFFPVIRTKLGIDPDMFLFGNPYAISDSDLVALFVLTVVTAVLVGVKYNSWVFTTFNPSLARSRGLWVRANNYLFIVLLALLVNLSVTAIGVLLINALLVVPAAAAANVAKNLRQMFWLTVGGSVTTGLLGNEISNRLSIPLGRGTGDTLEFGPSGTIVVLCVGWFFLTMAWAVTRGAGRSSGAGAG
jgi:zinc transport system permease protein